MPRCFVSIGSNIDAERNTLSAIDSLRETFGDCQVSPLYLTPAEGFDGDDFVNAVVAFDSDRSAADIHATLRRIEDRHGRVRGPEKFSSRTLDLDLLLYGDAVMECERFALPRDEIERYPFVLKPLCDLCPDCLYPLTGESYQHMWENMAQRGSHGLRAIHY
ncbi:MAG: 2-amino-4-hydroxy-6-hydroxymethyldihydropteridine diphosphokinase [Gammaproteobacteria bacterium]